MHAVGDDVASRASAVKDGVEEVEDKNLTVVMNEVVVRRHIIDNLFRCEKGSEISYSGRGVRQRCSPASRIALSLKHVFSGVVKNCHASLAPSFSIRPF
jgi:hypothetical protein